MDAPPRTEWDTPPLQCWHTWKNWIPELSPSLHVSALPQQHLGQAPCRCLSLYFCTCFTGKCLFFFILQREGKRKGKAEEEEVTVRLGLTSTVQISKKWMVSMMFSCILVPSSQSSLGALSCSLKLAKRWGITGTTSGCKTDGGNCSVAPVQAAPELLM